MTSTKKGSMKWNISASHQTTKSPTSARSRTESPSELYVYSDTFETTSLVKDYSDTFISDSYTDTCTSRSSTYSNNDGKVTNKAVSPVSDNVGTIISTEISTYFETTKSRTEAAETVIEVNQEEDMSDVSEGRKSALGASDTYLPDSYSYYDLLEKSKSVKMYSDYKNSQQAESPQCSKRDSYSTSYSISTYQRHSEDENQLDRSFVAPDHHGKFLVEEEEIADDTVSNDYSNTFETTQISSYLSCVESEKVKQKSEKRLDELAEQKFIHHLVQKLINKRNKYSQLESIPAESHVEHEDKFLRHYCKKKLKQLKNKKLVQSGEIVTSQSAHPLTKSHLSLLKDYGLPESVMDRAKLINIMSVMQKAAEQKIHEPKKCPQCSDAKLCLDREDAERHFATAHAQRLKNKIMDSKVENHLLEMNSVSMIGELARELPRSSETAERIFDKLFEPLLGKNVMR